MTALIFGHDEKLSAWCRNRIEYAEDFGPCRAIGMASDDRAKLWGVITYYQYSESAGTCMFALASINPRWATRETIRRLLSVPFMQYKVRKLMCCIASNNERSLRLAKGLGFKREAILRDQFADGVHGVVFSLLRGEFDARWGREDSFNRFRRRQTIKLAA